MNNLISNLVKLGILILLFNNLNNLLISKTCLTHKEFTCDKERKQVAKFKPKTFYLPRSQGSNTARRLAGWQEFLTPCSKYAYGNLSLAIEYTKSTKPDKISKYLFGSNCLSFKGSQVPDRNPNTDILADYFGLPTTFDGSICFKPKIKNIIVELSHYLALDKWCRGLYWRIYFPFVITFWDLGLNCKENSIEYPVQPVFTECYMSSDISKPTQTVSNIQDALSGCALFGDMNSPFDFGVIPFSRRHKSGVADIYFALGWNPIVDQLYHFAAFFQVIIPGGNRPKSKVVFEPIVGNGKSWEFGAGAEGHILFFSHNCQSLGLYFMGFVTHKFKTFQIRSFDFCKNGPFSRYMLLKELKEDLTYNGNLLNAIDYATKSARVGGLIHGDASIKLSYYNGPWGIDLGYNIWGKTTENLEIIPDVFPSDLNHRHFGFKGTEGVCYKILDTNTQTVINTASLNSTQNRATITHAGPVDNPASINLPTGQVAITWDSPTSGNLIVAKSSNPPVVICPKNLDPCSAVVPAQLTHKFFAHIGFTGINMPWEPQIGVGGEIEFNNKITNLSSLNQWGVWAKTQIVF